MLLKANKYCKDKKADCRQNELGSRIFVGRVFGDYAECLHFYPSFSYGRIIAAEKGIELIFDCNESLEHCALTQDKRWLGEAIINVLDNAIKYSPEHSKITIRLQKRTGFVRIEIEDQGIGIPQSEYHKIFQRFYRGTAPEVREKSGTGIGLYLSRQIIEQHGGTITVASGKVRKGSTFLIQLPENGLS